MTERKSLNVESKKRVQAEIDARNLLLYQKIKELKPSIDTSDFLE